MPGRGGAVPYTAPMPWGWILVGVGGVVAVWFVVAYNGLVRRRNRVDNAWGQVEVQLKRRYDLIPNLVEAVKGYAAHEQDTLQAVVEARNRALEATTPTEQAEAENVLTGALRRLFALAEAYPQLRASENFAALQAELAETENKIAVARQIYNDSVLGYNNLVQTIPTMVVARVAGFRPRDFFDAPPSADEAPPVAF